MSKVIREADDEVFDLLDVDYIEQQIQDDVVLFFACFEPNDREDDVWVSETGKLSYVITLPFDQVKGKTKEQVRELMLDRAQECMLQEA